MTDKQEYELINYFSTLDTQWVVLEQCGTGLMMVLKVTNNFKEAWGEAMFHCFNMESKLVEKPYLLEDEMGVGFQKCSYDDNPDELSADDFDYTFILRNLDYESKKENNKNE